MSTIESLLSKLAFEGGKIVSSNSLKPEAISKAREENRMYVDDSGLGYIWMLDSITPENKN